MDNNKEDEDVMLSTIDNPYNPFIQYDEWYAFDVSEGYNSCAYLARVCNVSDDMSEEQEIEETIRGMKEIVKFNLSGRHILVSPSYFKNRKSK